MSQVNGGHDANPSPKQGGPDTLADPTRPDDGSPSVPPPPTEDRPGEGSRGETQREYDRYRKAEGRADELGRGGLGGSSDWLGHVPADINQPGGPEWRSKPDERPPADSGPSR